MNQRSYFVYIATNKDNKVLYVGVTNSLIRRSGEHKNGFFENSFTKKYNINKIVYYEIWGDINQAIFREKQVKNLLRQKKIDLINNFNCYWNDLMDELFEIE